MLTHVGFYKNASYFLEILLSDFAPDDLIDTESDQHHRRAFSFRAEVTFCFSENTWSPHALLLSGFPPSISELFCFSSCNICLTDSGTKLDCIKQN